MSYLQMSVLPLVLWACSGSMAQPIGGTTPPPGGNNASGSIASLGLSASSDTGVKGDGVTRESAFTLTAMASPSTTVDFYNQDKTYLGTSVSDQDGLVTFKVHDVPLGMHTYLARLRGNEVSTTTKVTVDDSSPMPTTINPARVTVKQDEIVLQITEAVWNANSFQLVLRDTTTNVPTTVTLGVDDIMINATDRGSELHLALMGAVNQSTAISIAMASVTDVAGNAFTINYETSGQSTDGKSSGGDFAASSGISSLRVLNVPKNTDKDLGPEIQLSYFGSEGNVNHPENQRDVVTAVIYEPNDDPVTTQLSGDDADLFTFGDDGTLRFVKAPDFEAPSDKDRDNVYLVTLSAVSRQGTNSGLSDRKHLEIKVDNTEDIPAVFTSGPANNALIYHTENDLNLAVTYGSKDDDGKPALWSLGGPDGDHFVIDAGAVRFRSRPDFEQPLDADMDNTYQLNALVMHGTDTLERTLKVKVRNIENEFLFEAAAPEPGSVVRIPENSPASTIIATFGVENSTRNTGHTYTLSGTHKDLFHLDADGNLRFRSVPDLETRGNDPLTLTVEARIGGLKTSRSFSVQIQDVDEFKPEFVEPSQDGKTIPLKENTTSVGRFAARDNDGTDQPTYHLSGADSALFAIDAGGLLTFTSPTRFRKPPRRRQQQHLPTHHRSRHPKRPRHLNPPEHQPKPHTHDHRRRRTPPALYRHPTGTRPNNPRRKQRRTHSNQRHRRRYRPNPNLLPRRPRRVPLHHRLHRSPHSQNSIRLRNPHTCTQNQRLQPRRQRLQRQHSDQGRPHGHDHRPG